MLLVHLHHLRDSVSQRLGGLGTLRALGRHQQRPCPRLHERRGQAAPDGRRRVGQEHQLTVVQLAELYEHDDGALDNVLGQQALLHLGLHLRLHLLQHAVGRDGRRLQARHLLPQERDQVAEPVDGGLRPLGLGLQHVDGALRQDLGVLVLPHRPDAPLAHVLARGIVVGLLPQRGDERLEHLGDLVERPLGRPAALLEDGGSRQPREALDRVLRVGGLGDGAVLLLHFRSGQRHLGRRRILLRGRARPAARTRPGGDLHQRGGGGQVLQVPAEEGGHVHAFQHLDRHLDEVDDLVTLGVHEVVAVQDLLAQRDGHVQQGPVAQEVALGHLE
mmetsp:Transcript_106514/g.278141  ORF Transcript_106514/g.278141 Transcript_106514/m.278141 type:complete len:332 (-) Transcript_106514:932-1927(-)